MTPTSSRTLLIVGAASGIARALSRRLVDRGDAVILAARRSDELAAIAADLEVRRPGCARTVGFDALDLDSCATLVDRAAEAAGGHLHGVVVCHGALPPDARPSDAGAIDRAFRVNLVSAAVILERSADYFEQQHGGVIVAISSVAGDRGRQSNYLYGSAKAGLTAFLSGLRNRLHRRGVAVVTIKPGFVDTPMLRGRQSPPAFMVADPDRVAATMVAAIDRRRDVVYAPGYWRAVMTVIRLLPEWLFKRLSL
jgi:short-subunit dehydrogenase